VASVEGAIDGAPKASLLLMSLAALGIVFGDIGTSPLYTFKTILNLAGSKPDTSAILGSLSLVLWTLFIITTVKYVSFAMRVDNDGEGGILALMSLLVVKKQQRPIIVALGLFGSALIYGDGAITPAISVLSALEGLNMATPVFQPYILPAATVILIALFALQPQGTARIGRAFGPVMLIWFVTTAALGIWGIFEHPSVFAALDPRYGLSYLFTGGLTGFLVLGGVLVRHGGRGPLCGIGPFRAAADPALLVCLRLSEPHPELCWSGGPCARRGAHGRQYILSALSAAALDPVGHSGDGSDDHR
jgi:KUP system potassium uptake protein